MGYQQVRKQDTHGKIINYDVKAKKVNRSMIPHPRMCYVIETMFRPVKHINYHI